MFMGLSHNLMHAFSFWVVIQQYNELKNDTEECKEAQITVSNLPKIERGKVKDEKNKVIVNHPGKSISNTIDLHRWLFCLFFI